MEKLRGHKGANPDSKAPHSFATGKPLEREHKEPGVKETRRVPEVDMEETDGKESQETGEEKPRWIDLFERESHRRYQMEHMRDKEYEDVSTQVFTF